MLPGPILLFIAMAPATWLLFPLFLWPYRNRIRYLTDVKPNMATPENIAIVFAARNEADNLAHALTHWRDITMTQSQIIAVNDRSTDATGALLESARGYLSQLNVLHVTDLPAGWLGKNHALQKGLEAAGAADWILFTDADVTLQKHALSKAVTYAAQENLDHLVVMPQIPVETLAERSFMLVFHILFFYTSPRWLVENRKTKNYLGIGAFNLVRRSAIERIGGFTHLRLSVDDDMRLGQALKTSGAKPGVLLGRGEVSVRWQKPGAWNLIRGLEKNFPSAFDFRLSVLALAMCGVLWLTLAPLALLANVGTALWLLAGLGALIYVFAEDPEQMSIRPCDIFLLPLGGVLMAFTGFRSLWITWKNAGIQWRETRYGLRELRAHCRERNAWLRAMEKSVP